MVSSGERRSPLGCDQSQWVSAVCRHQWRDQAELIQQRPHGQLQIWLEADGTRRARFIETFGEGHVGWLHVDLQGAMEELDSEPADIRAQLGDVPVLMTSLMPLPSLFEPFGEELIALWCLHDIRNWIEELREKARSL